MLSYYLDRTDDSAKRAKLREQHLSAANDGTIVCECGWKRALEQAYKCLYCGLWFCFNCAEVHFGQKVDEWVKEKRCATAGHGCPAEDGLAPVVESPDPEIRGAGCADLGHQTNH